MRVRSAISRALHSAEHFGWAAALSMYHNESNLLDQAGREAAFAKICAEYRTPSDVVLTDELWEAVADRIWRGVSRAANITIKKEN